MVGRIGRASVLALLTLATSSCGTGSGTATPGTFSVQRFQQSRARTEREVVAELGPGEEVQNSYTQSVTREHNLPAAARFLRWEDPDQPGVYYHRVIVDGKLLPNTYTWDSRPK